MMTMMNDDYDDDTDEHDDDADDHNVIHRYYHRTTELLMEGFLVHPEWTIQASSFVEKSVRLRKSRLRSLGQLMGK